MKRLHNPNTIEIDNHGATPHVSSTLADIEQSVGVPGNQHRMASLDGLRALAFLSVFFFHLGPIPGYTRGPIMIFNEIIGWGFLGVDLFFVISGFIITTLLLDEQIRTSKVNIKLFFQRRALRIWPLFYLTLAISIAGTVVFAKSNFDYNSFGQLLRDTYVRLACFLYIVPLPATELLAKVTSQTCFPITHLLLPLWSVCIEEQFYLVWPWIIAITKNRRHLVLGIVAAVAIGEYCRTAGVTGWSGAFYLNPVSRIAPLAIGALIAIGDRSRNRIYRFIVKHAGVLSILSITTGTFILIGPSRSTATLIVNHYPNYLIVVIALGGLLLAILRNDFAKRIFSTAWLGELGKLTYCMYLVHFSIIYVTVTGPFQFLFIHDNIVRHVLYALISFSITLVIAKLSWKFIEKPLSVLRARLVC
ncbi:hypothetical protein BH10CYA1_BH10CYA1_38870 [soil metagenome]